MYPETEIIFPFRKLHKLRHSSGEKWQDLVDRVSALPNSDPDAIAMNLVVAEVCECLKCRQSSYKAALGCEACAKRNIAAVKSGDTGLLRRFKRAQKKVAAFQQDKPVLWQRFTRNV